MGMQMQVLHWTQEKYGKKHPNTISSVKFLATIYQDLGDLERAEQLYIRVRDFRLDLENPAVLSTKCDLASLYQIQYRLEEAEEAHLQNKDIALRLFGVGHSRCLAIDLALARTYVGLDRNNEAETLLQDTLRASDESLGPQDPLTISCRLALARFCATHGREDESLLFLEHTLETCIDQLGNDNVTTRRVLRILAFTLWKLDRR